ncbi:MULTISPECIES: N-acetyldiaminopimelate deacetylase [Thermoactinomyces]|uniref:N-acetyldiaminopimelate deacetylase n=1 Tax=Thermoactinomyces vulgaris TaxID=2026 RepID=A0ABS0QIJ5_THEVU|nr:MULTISPECIES: N-acetyldiaminopimelate deacetylase [Thermoactinomyces]KFZ40729.1 N-acetyldiaminopimelate deacetylase [Thermoactinomyces sp. Gus2-1]KYQ87158.1 N-acetyldiaminopimelate deacetylase [Thermoactinomyces sp. AS95]MBA4552179.1 N-acetyldiaminopimelate deacetylase [Thermoactinomyces vulgaris]MBA4597331.1 N-acetyldiaminopimelate deacetylase [Thermoactinomyces vulgaris]MBH8584252.1 N-acetyldiaminopimelate deacetylase [Thermoactinomyces sp. CICC 10735]
MDVKQASPFIELRHQLHQIPEPGFQEFKTQKHLLNYLETLPKHRRIIRTWKTGILVKVPGKNPKKCIGYRTDMDGLPMEEQTSYPFRSLHEGYMHACGHDMHMAIALGILTHFVHHETDDDLLFIFQPAEEGPGGAWPMLQSPEFNEWRPDVIFALHVAPEYPVGTIALRPGLLFANTSELFIDLHGTGGHAARPHLANDMVIACAQLVQQLQTVVSRNLDPLDAAIITIGKIEAGTKQNIIAGHARLEGTIRTKSIESMNLVKNRIRELVRGIETGFQCRADIDWGCNYCQVYNDEKWTKSFMEFVNRHTPYELVQCDESMAGEDFGYFLNEIPGFMFWLGVETPYGLHHPKMEPRDEAIPVAVSVMTKYLEHLGNRPQTW